MKEITNRWKEISCSLTERISIVKMTVLLKAIYDLMQSNITNGITHRTRAKILKFVMRHKISWIANAILRKKNGAGGIKLTPDYITKL